MQHLIDIFRDLPGYLDGFVHQHGVWVYVLLFGIIFAETGLVLLPFLPGDSLLFTVGVLAARGTLNLWLVSGLLVAAAVIGDAVNYHLGKWLGPRVFRFEAERGAADHDPTRLERMLNRKHLDRAHAFYEKYGGKAVVLGRFVPIVRTFVPFVAGAGAMTYPKFVLYNIVGAVLWVGICVGAGHLFGERESVQKNFEMVVVAIIFVSLIPVGVEFILARARQKKQKKPIAPTE